MDPASGPYCLGTCDVISRIDTSGKYGLTFHLKSPYAAFISGALGNIAPWPTSWKSDWASGDVKAAVNSLFTNASFNFENSTDYPTNGPYIVDSFSANDRIILKPMKYYQTLGCGSQLKNLIFVFYASKPGLIAAAGAGETDVTQNYTLADLPDLKKHTDAFKTYVTPAYQFESLRYNTDPTFRGNKNPLADLRVRQAMNLAIDKLTALRSALGLNKADAQAIESWSPLIITKALVQPFADKAVQGAWDPIAKKYQINAGNGQALADAKKLLTQAGYPGGGFNVEGVTTSGNPVRQAEFAVVGKSLSNVGITFQPDFIPASKLFSDFAHGSPLHTGDFQIAMFTDVGSPDPDAFKFEFQSQYIDREHTVHAALFNNYGGIHDSTLDTDFNKAAHSLDKKVRQQYYYAFQVRIAQQAYLNGLYYRVAIDTSDGKVGNWKPDPSQPGITWNTWEWHTVK
jgi:ABC-type transport system substrate-binding protein